MTPDHLSDAERELRRLAGVDPLRGTGRTTKQLLGAPKDAFYVVAHRGSADHTRQLALQNARPDLQVVTLEQVQTDTLRGLNQGVVVDHHVWEHLEQVSDDARRRGRQAIELLMAHTQRGVTTATVLAQERPKLQAELAAIKKERRT